jgi:hypothetical protein
MKAIFLTLALLATTPAWSIPTAQQAYAASSKVQEARLLRDWDTLLKVVDVAIQTAARRGEFETYVDVDSQYWDRLQTLLMKSDYYVSRTDSQYHFTMLISWKHLNNELN